MSEPNIRFSYDGKRYELPMSAYNTGVGYIILPTGVILEVGGWFESYPPQPSFSVTNEFLSADLARATANTVDATEV